MIRLKDIAETCGVSVATVSRALNGLTDGSRERTAMICRTAREMGYYPNAAARTLKTSRSSNIGILYEDVDVTNGNIPGSVVTKGEVYEDRLAITGESYDAVTPETGDNPSEKGWYERSGSAGAYVYTLTDDTTVQDGTTYYAKSDVKLASAAKTALEAKGFIFKTVPEITRPDFD